MIMLRKLNPFQRNDVVSYNVEAIIIELRDIPISSGILFAKWKVVKGGSESGYTNREEIDNKLVRWNHSIVFSVTVPQTEQKPKPDTMVIRISIRQETNGGKSFKRIGVCEEDLSKLVGCGPVNKSLLIQESEINSILKVKIHVTKKKDGLDSPMNTSKSTHSISQAGDYYEDSVAESDATSVRRLSHPDVDSTPTQKTSSGRSAIPPRLGSKLSNESSMGSFSVLPVKPTERHYHRDIEKEDEHTESNRRPLDPEGLIDEIFEEEDESDTPT